MPARAATTQTRKSSPSEITTFPAVSTASPSTESSGATVAATRSLGPESRFWVALPAVTVSQEVPLVNPRTTPRLSPT